MLPKIIGFILLAFLFFDPAYADEDVVRLPGQGEIKQELQGEIYGRLVPGGGLLLSFDADKNGEITPQEIEKGIPTAFDLADRNEDKRMTPLEQISWIETLPTRDVSLANPARFDPNLDRSVRIEEFTEIILALAANYADPTSGSVFVDALKSDSEKPVRPIAPPGEIID